MLPILSASLRFNALAMVSSRSVLLELERSFLFDLFGFIDCRLARDLNGLSAAFFGVLSGWKFGLRSSTISMLEGKN
jgi:hypothetical protein